MAGKARVHELARELGVASKEILTWLNGQGVFAKSASSTVEKPIARQLREFYGLKHPGPEQPNGHEDARAAASIEDPPYVYVRDKISPAAHHWDYLNDHNDESLCGHGYVDPVTLGEVPRPRAVCRACQARLPEYHAKWWRDRLEAAEVELEDLRVKYHKLQERSNNQRKQLATLQQKMHEANQNRQKRSSKLPDVKKSRPKSVVSAKRLSNLGIPVGKRRTTTAVEHRVVDEDVKRKRLEELYAPRRPKSAAEREADQIAADRMRSQKPSSWRLGRSPSSYG
jgi:hypothetical protein